MAKIFNTIEVNASGNYQVIVGENLLEKVGEFLSPLLSPCKIAVITDDIVDGLYAKQVINSLENSGFQVFKFVFKKGEESKNLSTYGEILSFLARHEFSRTDGIVALGGGVVGDISGFVAA
ncbi:MAG: iron-containing alcohol dehydrogenase, partial [Clostridia bacterium]|nr:iron-containing alcohol dehydrogenase [Clostridia bacterium]